MALDPRGDVNDKDRIFIQIGPTQNRDGAPEFIVLTFSVSTPT